MTEEFGPNIWLVDQMYRRYLESPESVSEAWQDFFSDYEPGGQVQDATDSAREAAEEPKPTPEPEAIPIEVDDAAPTPLIGGAAVIAERMGESLELPTATSVRQFPAKLLEVNRKVINNQLARLTEGGKVSFTHLIAWAVIRALEERPGMNAAYQEIDGKPHIVRYPHINLGLAVDVERRDGSRTLLVPNVKQVDEMTFAEFWRGYENVIQKVRAGDITPEDFAGTTATITNPGTVGTVQSVPRLMPGQGVIVGVGAIKYPPEWEGADPETLARIGVGRTITLTSTYDHRIIQGAESGLFLQRIHQLLLGENDFYDEIFQSMGIPYVPARWAFDQNPPAGSRAWAEKQARVFQLVNMYRVRGHLIADLDPLRMDPPEIHPELDPLKYGLTLWDLDREFPTAGLGTANLMKLGDIMGLLRDAYCRTVGVEYMHIQEPEQKTWIQQRVERRAKDADEIDSRRILAKLNQAEAFETFLHRKYLGNKRFSLEGSETLIPLLDAVLNAAADAGIEDVTIGMSHRGRLNVLANIIGKSLTQIFREFEGHPDPNVTQGQGDVKYHLGASGSHEAPSGKTVALEVASNPSHLEAVDPVLEGIVRAKQDLLGEGGRDRVLPLLLHGDAAFSGQGVVAETLNLSQLAGYTTGGTIHVVINNQVGFTTSVEEARSSMYATDIAKAVQAPIFHINGDDPEAAVRVAKLAFAFRQAFHKDVVIDLVCYRKWGHNEGDEPSYTQPLMYRKIESHRSPRKLYLERLVNRGEISLEEGEAVLEDFRSLLDAAFSETQDLAPPAVEKKPPADPLSEVDTTVARGRLDEIMERLVATPEDFAVHPKLTRVLNERRELYRDGTVDWAAAEGLAFGSLTMEGHTVRLAGEDSSRGTFSHRHGILVDYENGNEWLPLAHLHPDQAPVHLIDSMLSEFAAMGFEYGYSVGNRTALVLWEAQFGDFVNGAQVIIDQFLLAGEYKWGQAVRLGLLLPHGYEGQGPEHSSARIERFLTNAADQNMRIVVPSSPAQLFHALRRQVHHPLAKPLVAFTPKSLLRARHTFSPITELTRSSFRPVLPDQEIQDGAERVLLCSGKIYWELLAHREENEIDGVAIVRMEQLYPFPVEDLRKALAGHSDAEIRWVQEEPENMGASRFMFWRLNEQLGLASTHTTRRYAASPATGSFKVHQAEQQELIERAFAP